MSIPAHFASILALVTLSENRDRLSRWVSDKAHVMTWIKCACEDFEQVRM